MRLPSACWRKRMTERNAMCRSTARVGFYYARIFDHRVSIHRLHNSHLMLGYMLLTARVETLFKCRADERSAAYGAPPSTGPTLSHCVTASALTISRCAMPSMRAMRVQRLTLPWRMPSRRRLCWHGDAPGAHASPPSLLRPTPPLPESSTIWHR